VDFEVSLKISYSCLSRSAMAASKRKDLDLGYAEPISYQDSWFLESRFFPSKIGGLPAWLNPEFLPSSDELKCPKCSEPCVFLTQIYAPRNSSEDTFHRAIFVFLCRKGTCYQDDSESPEESSKLTPLLTFRCQLPKINAYWPSEPPEEDESYRPDLTPAKWSQLCRVCGCPAAGEKSLCGGCKKVRYCCKDHQTADWKHGGHKKECADPAFDPSKPQKRKKNVKKVVLPEFELIIEPAEKHDYPKDDHDDDDDDDGGEINPKELEKFKKLEAAGHAGTLTEGDMKSKEKEDETEVDMAFVKFKAVIKKNPDQVLRYQDSGKPLWISKKGRISDPERQIPPCEACGARRVFEFQVMPQMLNHLSLDTALNEASIDWGVLAVYTCSENCKAQGEGKGYLREFIYKQKSDE